jgi:NAD(P)H-hydrate epimerase
MAAARKLANWGARVRVVLTKPRAEFMGVAGEEVAILERMGAEVWGGEEIQYLARPALIIDGLIGYGLKGAPRGVVEEAIEWMNKQPAPTLAVDLPSGLDAKSGARRGAAVKANVTVTWGLPKRGLLAGQAKPYVGTLYLADIGVPPELWERAPLRLAVGPVFAESEILHVAQELGPEE